MKRNTIITETMNGLFDKVKKAGKGVVDAGAKTMLKVTYNDDFVFFFLVVMCSYFILCHDGCLSSTIERESLQI